MREMKRLLYIIGVILVLASCSTTKRLPEGEVLYTGQKPMIIKNPVETKTGVSALEEVDAALAKAPNNAFLGSSVYRTPFPVGLWFYNRFAGSKRGLGKWFFDHFAATPVLMSTVNPDIRIKAASNILHEYGDFNATVNYKAFVNPKDSLK